MKKANCDVFCGEEFFARGQVYSDKQVAHLDPRDFSDVGGEEADNATTGKAKPMTAKQKAAADKAAAKEKAEADKAAEVAKAAADADDEEDED